MSVGAGKAPRFLGHPAELNAQPIKPLIRNGTSHDSREPSRGAWGFTCIVNSRNRAQMTKHLLAVLAAVVLTSGVAFAQIYPPPRDALVIPAPPTPPVPVPGTTTTTAGMPSPDGDHRETTIHRKVDRRGNTVTEKDTHREGIGGSTETHTKTETDRDGGTTTTRETTTR